MKIRVGLWRAFFALVSMVCLVVVGAVLTEPRAEAQKDTVAVGSKLFTESYILSEIFARLIETRHPDIRVDRRTGLGGTGMLFAAMKKGEVDIYPEYTGTILRTLLKTDRNLSYAEIAAELKKHDLLMSAPLGFNNTYAIAMREEHARRLNIESIADLAQHPELRLGFTHEFIKRQDGFVGLSRVYGLHSLKPNGIDHALAYEALGKNRVDVIDVFSTDAKILRYKLKILDDAKNFFPKYMGVILVRREFAEKHPQVWQTLKSLEGQIGDQKMTEINAMVDLDKKSYPEAAAAYLNVKAADAGTQLATFLRLTYEHCVLVFVSLFAAVCIGIPLGVLATFSRTLGQAVLLVSGLLQTIPSLALLCLLIPLFGIGYLPAMVALLLYGLLPIVRNTYTGIQSIAPGLKESAQALGLNRGQQIRKVMIPLASPYIMAGIKTSAVINVGTATLAALIGAGGYGVPIITGLNLNDNGLILSGAIPAAGLAIILHIAFSFIDRATIPRGLRLKTSQ